MVKLAEILSEMSSVLESALPRPIFEARLIAAHCLKMDTALLGIHQNLEVEEAVAAKMLKLAKKRATFYPMAYLLGVKEFMSLEFKVDENVLIPRPETEELCELIIDMAKDTKPDILDLCTGSGAILCSLLHYIPLSVGTGVDVSEGALMVAKENAKKLGVDKRADFIPGDVLSSCEYKKKYDIAVSNPPYIESNTINSLDKTVKDFEPLIALDGGDDGLSFYRKIIADADKFLKKGGMLFLEIGYNQGEAVLGLMDKRFKKARLIKDLSGHDRIISAQLA